MIPCRLLCVVPIIGSGTAQDPRRPLFAPWPPSSAQTSIIGFAFQESDDGHFALVEFIARDRAALTPLLSAARADVKVFEKGRHSRAEIETEFRRFKRNFDLDKFVVRVP